MFAARIVPSPSVATNASGACSSADSSRSLTSDTSVVPLASAPGITRTSSTELSPSISSEADSDTSPSPAPPTAAPFPAASGPPAPSSATSASLTRTGSARPPVFTAARNRSTAPLSRGSNSSGNGHPCARRAPPSLRPAGLLSATLRVCASSTISGSGEVSNRMR